jgi:uncharacterized RDD family membrane protein YckC
VGALAAVFVSDGLAMSLSFAIFIVARQLTAAAFGARGGAAPFGEPPSSAFAGARRGARLAVTVAGPLALFVVGTLLAAAATFVGGTGRPGTRIEYVVDRMPAERAGLRAGDRVVALAGKPVTDPAAVHPLLEHVVGDSVAVTIRRDGAELTVPVSLDERRKLGVAFGADAPTAGDALSRALLLWPHTIEAYMGAAKVEVAGPVALAQVADRAASRAKTIFLAACGMIVLSILPLLTLASLFLFPVGTAPPRQPGTPPGPGARRPWTRLAARLVDYTLMWIALLAPSGFDVAGTANLHGNLVTIAFVPAEALCLAFLGATPGKWLLGLAVVDGAGGRLRLRVAFRRAALVFTYGLAAGMPLGLATTVLAHRRVATAGSAYWDELEGSAETHRDVSGWRKAAAGAVLVAFVGLLVLLAAAAIPR